MATVAGTFSFLAGIVLLLALPSVGGGGGRERLYELNTLLGSATVYLLLGGFLVVQAASALGNTSSKPMRFGWAWLLLPAFPPLLLLGQYLASNPGRAEWLFPFVNVGAVAVPSLSVAALAAWRYSRQVRLSWPVSWREWTTGFTYGAIGATTVAGFINTVYIVVAATVLVAWQGGAGGGIAEEVRSLPRGWGIFLDLSALSLVAPLHEEFWKGMLVGFFFFRRGGPARCFVWGVIAGAGFNLLETFVNSLAVVDPGAGAGQRIGEAWWLFAVARAGTALMHPAAAGLAALGLYGLFRGQRRYLLGYPAAVLTHAAWNFFVYLVDGEAFLSGQGWDSALLDAIGTAGLLVEAAVAGAVIWFLPARLGDGPVAPPYRLLGMAPARAGAPRAGTFAG